MPSRKSTDDPNATASRLVQEATDTASTGGEDLIGDPELRARFLEAKFDDIARSPNAIVFDPSSIDLSALVFKRRLHSAALTGWQQRANQRSEQPDASTVKIGENANEHHR